MATGAQEERYGESERKRLEKEGVLKPKPAKLYRAWCSSCNKPFGPVASKLKDIPCPRCSKHTLSVTMDPANFSNSFANGRAKAQAAIAQRVGNGVNSGYAQGKIRKIEQMMTDYQKGIGTNWEQGAVRKFIDQEFQGLPKGYAAVTKAVKAATTFAGLKAAMQKLDSED